MELLLAQKRPQNVDLRTENSLLAAVRRINPSPSVLADGSKLKTQQFTSVKCFTGGF